RPSPPAPLPVRRARGAISLGRLSPITRYPSPLVYGSLVVAGRLGRQRGEQIQPQPFREKPGRPLSSDAVAGGIQRRGERAHAPLARDHGDDPAADAALPRQADIVEPVAGGFV